MLNIMPITIEIMAWFIYSFIIIMNTLVSIEVLSEKSFAVTVYIA